MDDSLHTGVAIYNADAHRAVYGAWESERPSFEHDIDDERFLHGFIQFTVAVHHTRDGDDSNAVGFTRSAREYLNGLANDYRNTNLVGVRKPLARLEADPGIAADPPAFRLDNRVVIYDDPDFGAVAIAAETLAEELDGYDESVIADTIGYAHEGVVDGEQTQFTAMVFGLVWNKAQRELVFQQSSEHVRRRRRCEDDVNSLFD